MVADMFGCSKIPAMSDSDELEALCVTACKEAGLTVLGSCFRQFFDKDGNRAGATGAVVLAESHLTVHTWPELGSAAVDAYVCNYSKDNSDLARGLVESVRGAFEPQRVESFGFERAARP